MSTQIVCASCENPLVVDIEPDEEEIIDQDTSAVQTVPDDVRLPCGCHFHWECLLESYELSRCPQCNSDITSVDEGGSNNPNPTQRIVVDLNNEGGLQEQIDIFPILKEESYLRAYPEERKCRAFLEFCREGDYHAIVELLQSGAGGDHEDDVEMEIESVGPPKSLHEILRYQDPIGDMASGLHAAVANGHQEVAWLLLLLASDLPLEEFPALVFQEAASLGIMRPEDESNYADIRSLTDAHGRTAEDLAKEAGVIWNGWIGNARLTMP